MKYVPLKIVLFVTSSRQRVTRNSQRGWGGATGAAL